MIRPALLLVLLSASACSLAPAQRIDAIDSLLQAAVDAEHVAGAVIQVKRGDELVHRAAYGFSQRYDFERRTVDHAMSTRHVFDLASLSKVFGTTFAVMLLVDRGDVDLDAPVGSYLPLFAGGEKDRVTVRHLLTHTGGLIQWWPLYYRSSSAEATYAEISALPLEFEVGEGRHYSDLGFMLLGYLVEEVSGQTLDTFLQQQLYGPLGLDMTTYRPLEHGIEATDVAATSHGNPFERRMVYDADFGYDVAVDPTSWDDWRDYTLRGEVNDGNAYHANGGVAGHAGLFSTVDELQVLVDVLLARGQHRGESVVGAETIATFLTPDATGNGLGWAMDEDVYLAPGAPDGTFGHTGFTGTHVVIVPEYSLSIIYLTNRQNVGPAADGTYYDLNPTRRHISQIVLDHVR